MPFFEVPSWISRRFRRRTTIQEMNDALNLDDDNTNINEIFDNERLLFQFIMRRWISEMDQRFVDEGLLDANFREEERRNVEQERDSQNTQAQESAAPAAATQQQSATEQNGPEIPVLNMEDIDAALREHINDNQRGTFWIKFIDIIGITIFPMLFLRILKNVFSFISFSDDILEDTDNFLLFVHNNSFESLAQNNEPQVNSLVSKFGRIVYEEMNRYFANPNPYVTKYLTLLSFFIYTTFTSLFMMVSFVFLLLCLTFTIGKRWRSIDKFLVNVSRDSNGVF